jgi:hypothetical protein
MSDPLRAELSEAPPQFQQAKKPRKGTQFLQIVAKPKRSARNLRWDDAIQIVLDKTQLDRVRTEKQKAKKKSGDFTDVDDSDPEAPS